MSAPFDFAEEARRAFAPSEDEVYLDGASASRLPQSVLQAVTRTLTRNPFPPYRAQHHLGEEATSEFERARVSVAEHLGALRTEIAFFPSATAAINFLASALPLAGSTAGQDNNVVVSEGEHYSNLLPWTLRRPAKPVIVPVEGGVLDAQRLIAAMTPSTRLVTCSLMNHVTGAVAPVRQLADAAHARNAWVLVDAVSAAGRMPIDVRALGCDLLVVSAPSMYGVPGAAALYIQRSRQDQLGVALVGAGSAHRVDAGGTFVTPTDLPVRFEVGRQNAPAVIGFGAAARFLRGLGMEEVQAHDVACGQWLRERMAAIPGVRVLGEAGAEAQAGGIVSFTVRSHQGAFVQGWLADRYRILIGAGKLSAFPLLARMQTSEAVRASVSVFTTQAELEQLVDAVSVLAAKG